MIGAGVFSGMGKQTWGIWINLVSLAEHASGLLHVLLQGTQCP